MITAFWLDAEAGRREFLATVNITGTDAWIIARRIYHLDRAHVLGCCRILDVFWSSS